MSQREHDEFVRRVRRQLDHSLQRLDPDTRRQLAERRRQALAQAAAPRPWLKPALSLALTTGLLILGLVLLWPDPRASLPALPPLDDLELLSSKDELELFEELEFYQWLEQDHEQG